MLLCILVVVCLLLLTLSCSSLRVLGNGPDVFDGHGRQIRVGLLQNQSSVRFMINGAFFIYDAEGRFVARGLSGYHWQARVLAPPRTESEYRLKFTTTQTREDARNSARFLTERNLRFEILQQQPPMRKRLVQPSGDGQEQVLYHVVLWDIFRSRREAEAARQRLAEKAPLEVFEYRKNAEVGIIELANLDTGDLQRINNLATLDTDRFALLDLPVGAGYHWEGTKDLVFRGAIELVAEPDQKLTVINVVDLDSYLRGVVPSEMPREFPPEALKAQAVAARTEVLKRSARHAAEGFDICATVHCQVYNGMTNEAEATDRAIRETAGLVLKKDGRIVDAVYTGVCGGHTENNENVWDGLAQSHLRGVFDGPGAPDLLGGRLREERIAQRWIERSIPAYCNTTITEIPAALEYTKKYYRWREEIPRLELERAIQAETGQRVGALLDIIPLERGASGRLRRVRVVGTERTIEIAKELSIRRAFSPTTLFSACFVVEKVGSGGALPRAFIFRGAGWGHGVGMCQTGAAMMALKGFSFEQILQHYYTGVQIAPVK